MTISIETEEDWTEFAQALRKARREAGLSQRQLAEQLGLAQAAIAQYEAGSRRPTVGNLLAMAVALGIVVALGRQMGGRMAA
jgi:transcriptional regulator with XRE-family HTH domain